MALLILSTIEFDTKIVKTEATPLTISFLNENVIDNIKEIKTKNEDSRVKNLSIDEKIELYNKIRASKEVEKNNKMVYEKSTKKIEKRKVEESPSVSSDDENEFSYYYTPVYVAESRVNTEEKRKLMEDREV